MKHTTEYLAYKRESVLGLLDTLSPDTRVLVTIPGRDPQEMTVEEFSQQISELESSNIGPKAIEKIDVQVMPPPKKEKAQGSDRES